MNEDTSPDRGNLRLTKMIIPKQTMIRFRGVTVDPDGKPAGPEHDVGFYPVSVVGYEEREDSLVVLILKPYVPGMAVEQTKEEVKDGQE